MKEKPSIPGIEEYAGNPYLRSIYHTAFNMAKRILLNPDIASKLKPHVTIEQLAAIHAKSVTEERSAEQNDLKEMGKKINLVGRQIIEERGWDKIPQGKNFAWQLYGEDSLTAQSLDNAELGYIMESKSGIGRLRPNSQIVIVARFSDIPDLLNTAKPSQTLGDLMEEFYFDLLTKLGFLEEGEDVAEKLDLQKYWESGFNHTCVEHPKLRFDAVLRSDTRSLGDEMNEDKPFDSIEIRYRPSLIRSRNRRPANYKKN